MKPKPSPPAARCPVPAKLPEPIVGQVFVSAEGYDVTSQAGYYPHGASAAFTATIYLHRRPSKAQLRAVQEGLNRDPGQLNLFARKVAREKFEDSFDIKPGLGTPEHIADAVLHSIGLMSKPGQHAGDKGKR